jgi:Zn-finger nucleic acid-binding protein
MNCPNCNAVLENRFVVDVQVETCPQCRGVWFASGELDEVKEEINHDLRWMEADLWKDAQQFSVDQRTDRKCPVDQTPLAAVCYGPTDVTVDTCLKCRGIWLDAGEFEKIIDALEDHLSEMNSSEYEKAALKQARQIVTGDKGLSSELHDFRTVMRFLEYRILVEHPKVRDALLALQKGLPTQYW